jgi:hypothetical protein
MSAMLADKTPNCAHASGCGLVAMAIQPGLRQNRMWGFLPSLFQNFARSAHIPGARQKLRRQSRRRNEFRVKRCRVFSFFDRFNLRCRIIFYQ